jgi:hypothetical protein
MDITTLLPPPNRRSSPPPQPTQVSASAPQPNPTTEAAPAAATTPSQPVASNSNGAQFRVLVIPDASDNLQQLQQLVPNAAETVFNGRNVWQVGLYSSRSSAQSVLDQLLDAGFEAMAEMIFSAN